VTREFLDSILDFIGTESLSDLEFDLVDPESSEDYSPETYALLKDILELRSSSDDILIKLGWFFKSKGVDVLSNTGTPKSNIFIGAPLA
jgi:hypothetical protein